jgi:folate-binding Fe-S cluster repair protein YgfZ
MSAPVNDISTDLAWSVLEARGEDARSFLQGQLSQDLDAVDASGAWTLVLAPDSVVIAACFVRVRDDGVDLVVARELAEATLARLKRFLLRSKCTLALRDVETGPFASTAEQISARWPGPKEIARSLTPHTFGRRFVDETVSFRKGCFTGQELVGRLDARGSSVPWRFVRVEGPSVAAIDDYLRAKGPDGPQGLTSALETEGRVVALGIAHRTLLAEEPPREVTLEEIQ